MSLSKKRVVRLNFERRMVDPITRGALALYIAKNNSKIRNLPILVQRFLVFRTPYQIYCSRTVLGD